MAHFTAPDLHLDWFYSTLLDGHATPIVGITTDIDGEPRNALTPDIGADEGVVVPVELTSFMALANGEEVTLSWSTATELNNYGFEVQRKALQVVILLTVGFSQRDTAQQPHPNNYSLRGQAI